MRGRVSLCARSVEERLETDGDCGSEKGWVDDGNGGFYGFYGLKYRMVMVRVLMGQE